ncbi:MAG: acyltransferase family protein, partial [Leptothrix sp. (in: b-proteobacteria)]
MKPASLPTVAAPLPHHLPSLDGLRGLAIVLVLLHNFDVLDLAGPHSLAAALLKEVFFLGWIGVQLFFVLSGFLITRGLLATQQSDHYFSHFMLKRALRIFPLYYLALGLFTLLLPKLGLIAPPADPTWWLWVYLANWSIPLHLGGESMPHFWSLAVEEQFYLLWPLLLWRLRLRQVAWLCLALMLLSPLLRWLLMSDGEPPEALYEFTVCRMDALAAGAALAAWFHRPLREPAQPGEPIDTSSIVRQLTRHIERWSAGRWGALTAGLLVATALSSHGFWRLGATAQVLGYSLLALSFTAMVGWAVLSDQAASQG